MPFNSDTYHANKHRKAALAGIEKARDIKARAARGEAYEWEVARIPLIVKLARGDMNLSRMYRRHAAERKAWRR